MNLNKKHFEYFKKQVLYYQKKFDLMDWRITINCIKHHSKFRNGVNENEFWNGCATISLILNDYRTEGQSIYKALKECARHEVLHLILTKFETLAKERHTPLKDIEEELEVVVRKFTRLLTNI